MKYGLLGTTALAALAGSALVAPSAQATPMAGSDSIISFNQAPTPGSATLFSMTSINLTSNFWSGGSGDFALIPSGTPIGDTALTLANLAAFALTSADGNFNAAASIVVGGSTFASAETGSTGSAASGTETLSFYLVGTFNTAGTTAIRSSDSADVTMSFTETGITTSNAGAGGGGITGQGSFSVSATIAAPAGAPPPPPPPPPPTPPPPVSTPEPTSMLILGAGLFGLGAVRRRRRS